MKRSLLIYTSLFLTLSCNNQGKNEKLLQLISPEQSGIWFKNDIQESDSMNVLEFLNIYTGGGIASGDINNDGLVDLFFTGNMVSSKLYLNESNDNELKFEDVTELAGVLTDQWMTGVTMVDINQDGLLDIYVCSSGNKRSKRENKLFVNQGVIDGIPYFKESAKEYGIDDNSYSTQATFFDYDNDGDLDLFIISNFPENYLGNLQNVPTKKVEYDPLKSDKLYKNFTSEKRENVHDSLPLFRDVSLEAGITHFGYSLGIATSDINNDGFTDIYIANDFISNDIMYINNGDGTFSNKASDYFQHTSFASMGIDIADFNNDGNTDIIAVDMIPEDNLRMKSMLPASNYSSFMLNLKNGYYPQFSRNTLQLNNGVNNNGNISFSEIGRLAGVHHTDWSWSAFFADIDNDGWKDLFITNGFKRDLQDLDFVRYFDWPNTLSNSVNSKGKFLERAHKLNGVKVPNYIFKNNKELAFQNVTKEWGIDQPSYSHGAVYCDLDNDGDLDLVINNVDDYPFLYKNNSNKVGENNYLKIKFLGNKGNLNGIGAKIQIKCNKELQFFENYPVKGFQSSMNIDLHIGLGKQNVIEELIVTWPDGKKQLLKNVEVNKELVLSYQNAKNVVNEPEKKNIIFSEVGSQHNLNFKHQEHDYVDFNSQRLLSFKLSQNGPGLAVGDINNDGLDDFFIGGPKLYNGSLFIQKKDSNFKSKLFEEDANYEDLGALFFDADGDGDLDFYVVSGSVEMGNVSQFYQDRLYVNDGAGNFNFVESALPNFYISGSCVVAADFDKDGDLDLFVGGRSMPGEYPLPPSSKILLNISKENNQPVFIDATNDYLPELNNIGMVTASLWSDYNNDGWVDLIVVGEGMYVTIFENKEGKFKNVSSKIINNTTGFWNSITASDFNNDGFTDYVIGNLGQNTLLKASKEQPVRIYAKDFDSNGFIDPILSHYILGKNVPLHSRDEFIEQMPGMRSRFLNYSDYASLTTEEILKDMHIENAYILKYENFETSYLQNNQGEELTLKSLPIEVQFSPVFGMITEDFDQDGIADIMITGNSYAPNTQLGWNNASKGTILKGLGGGEFKPLSIAESGFFADKDVKSVSQIFSASNEPLILITKNNGFLSTFTYKLKNSIVLPLNPLDSWADIKYKNGKVEKKEFYYGSGYLSQNSRKIIISSEVQHIDIYDFSGNKRNIPLSSISMLE